MDTADRVLEMMLGVTSSGIGYFDDFADQVVWVDDGCLVKSDADVAAFKREDEGENPMEEYELPTLLPKRWIAMFYRDRQRKRRRLMPLWVME